MTERKSLQFLSLCAGLALVVLASSNIFGVRAANDNNGSQDEKLMIQTGLAAAVSLGIPLNMSNKDADMVGLGSYMVNVASGCNGCHSAGPATEYAPGGNPYLLTGPNPPLFSGRTMVNLATYLGGGRSFGSFGPGPAAEIKSANLTPDKNGKPEGHTLAQFIQIFRTGIDPDGDHPSCGGSITTNCLSFPFNGAVLQVMPWPAYQKMTDRQITAIYTYLSAIPCLAGGDPNRCH
ncbi:MAG TPA: hypothetical protein VL285_25385 [Bryobacteraceae bacterium]|nr:hypothetical protein [Bryobacteraceae bacterium]